MHVCKSSGAGLRAVAVSCLRAAARAAAWTVLGSLAAAAGGQAPPDIGISPAGAVLLHEQGAYPHSQNSADHFGTSLAVGDFDHDGFDDLAAGIPGNDCDVVTWDCGAVQVRFGADSDTFARLLTLDPNSTALAQPEPAHADDRYGEALAAGDFDGDGFDDLAVGIPNNDSVRIQGRTGGVQIHYGLATSEGGLQPAAADYLEPGMAGLGGVWVGERFGYALAVGDFDGDGFDDLAMGAPRYQVWNGSRYVSAGNAVVGHGGLSGLLPFEGFSLFQGFQGLPDQSEDGDDFGAALAAGDFDGDGFDDLAVGAPGEDGAGAVLVVYGSPFSLLFPSSWYFGQSDLGDVGESFDRFGESLAAGDFDGDGFDDLAVGAFREDGDAGFTDIGEVSIVYGGAAGLTTAGAEALFEHYFHGAQALEAYDNFGGALTAGDFDGDGVDDLAIGIEGDNGPANANTGGVTVVLGRRHHGLAGGVARKLYPAGVPSSPSYDPDGMIPDHREGDPFWGFALAAGDFDGNQRSDLAIGAPARDARGPDAFQDSGAVAVVFGRRADPPLFADGFESGDLGRWSQAVP